MKLERTTDFLKFLHKFQKVKRMTFANGEDRNENDAEHSFQLAMLGWFLNENESLGLNSSLIIKYSLVHDLVEAYAGDMPVPIYKNLKVDRSQKEENEAKALHRIKEEFKDFSEMSSLIEKYEEKSDEEAKFVYALDKILPMLNTYMDDGRAWKEHGGILKKLIEYKGSKVKISAPIEKIYDELMVMLKANEEKLFPLD